jgi:hypothetical protein
MIKYPLEEWSRYLAFKGRVIPVALQSTLAVYLVPMFAGLGKLLSISPDKSRQKNGHFPAFSELIPVWSCIRSSQTIK